VTDAAMGTIRIRFATDNAFGVADHDVTLPSGASVHNPLRVLPNATGSEVVFTLFRLPGVSDADLARDAGTVARDLAALKAVLEGPASAAAHTLSEPVSTPSKSTVER
jgi:hypothetical protein